MRIFSIDTWDNEKFLVYANGKNIFTEQFHYRVNPGKKICGRGYKDRTLKLKRSFAHDDDVLVLKVTSNLN
jgi:hypothetical protein